MKSIMLIALLGLCSVASAKTLVDGIHSIDKGRENEPHLVKFVSGAVEFIEPDDQAKLSIYEAKLKESKSISRLAPPHKMLSLHAQDYEPSIVPDSEIGAIFDRMNMFMRRKSECSDRAHVWAYDEFQNSGTKSQKAFLFLTDTYIRRLRYKWWFHVAPMFTTASGQKFVMDKQFLDRPVTFNEWKDLLVFSKRECVTDFSFNAYNAGADQTQDCYTKEEPMYYYIPADIAAFENGRGKTGWSTGEVNASRTRAFFKGSN